MFRGLVLALLGLVLAATAPAGDALAAKREREEREPRPKFEVLTRGVVLELMPAGTMCLPTLIFKCKLTGLGKTKPFVGGAFTFGFRAERHAMFGISYSGAAVQPDYNLPDRRYAQYGHLHHALGIVRVMFPLGRWEPVIEGGAGYSHHILPLEGGGKVFSQGFAAKVAAGVAVWLHEHFYMSLKVDFLLNVHSKVCREGLADLPPQGGMGPPVAQDRCIKRNIPEAKSEQIPIHLVMPGLAFGVQL